MAKIILICGKICVGKSTYSKKLMFEQKAVRLNSDELMKTFCGEFLGDRHEDVLQQTLYFIYKKAIEIYSIGINVIIDAGFLQRHYREEANQYFIKHNITPEWHYVDINDDLWMENIGKKNSEVERGISEDYYVDEYILDKFKNPVDKPKSDEIDVWYKNDMRRNMESNFSLQETQVRDAEGNRCIKCDFCGKIAMENVFNSDKKKSEDYMEYNIREMKSLEYPLLDDFLYEAIFQRDEVNLLPKSVIEKPELKVYIQNFGNEKDDYCFCAEVQGKIVGAVWVRNIRAYGSVDNETPEFAISLYKKFRGQGIGTQMMKKMIEHLKQKGYSKTSLAVQKDNYAVKVYLDVGFQIVDQNEEEYIMVHDLKQIKYEQNRNNIAHYIYKIKD